MSDSPSRAALELQRASSSPCAACGRESKTVEGVCAECWEPKEPGARLMAPERGRTPFFDVDVDPIWVYLGATAAAGVLMALLWALWTGS